MNTPAPSTRSAGTARPHLVAICGSRREGSYTRRALAEVLAGVEDAGGTGGLIDLAEADLPLFNPDLDAAGLADDALRERVRTLGDRVVRYAHIELGPVQAAEPPGMEV